MLEEKILSSKCSRRELLRRAALGGVGVVAASAIAACATPTPQVIKETVIVKETVPVKEVVKETVPVEKVVTKEVEKVVTKEVIKEVTAAPTPAPAKYNGYTAPSKPVPAGKIQLYVGLDPNSEKKLLGEFKDVFEKFNPGVTVELLNVAGEEKLLALIAAGTPPDVWWTGSAGTIQVADGSILDITDLLKGDPIMDDILPAYLTPYKGLDGGLYGLPNGTWFWGIYYNKKNLDAARASYPTDDWTWDDLLAIAQKSTKEGQWGYYNSGITWGGGLMPYILSNGGREVSEDGTRWLLDSPESLEAIQFLYDLIYKHKVMPSPDTLKGFGLTDRQAFANGKYAMQTDAIHPDVFPIFAEMLGWGNFDVVLLPHPKGKPLVNWAGFGGFSVSAKTKNPQAAVELLKFLGTGSAVWWPDPCYKSGIAAYIETSIQRYPQLKDTHFAEAFESGAKKVRFYSTNNPFAIWRYTGDDWNAFRDRLWAGKVKPEDLKTEVPKWNAKYAAGLEKDLKEVPLKPAYKEALQKILEEVKKRG